MKPVVFVGGSPGAGKTSLCSAVTASVPGSVAVTAGQLIQRGRGQASPNYIRRAVVDGHDADINQTVLVEQFAEVVAGATGPVLLDGHFVIPTASGLAPVAADVFIQLKIELLVLVDVEVATAAERLRARGGAAWWDGSLSTLEVLLAQEAAHAWVVAEALRKPLHITRTCALEEFTTLLASSVTHPSS